MIKKLIFWIKSFDSVKFIFSLVDNLPKGADNSKCKDCKICLEVKDKLWIFKCLKYHKNHKKHFHKEFWQGDLNEFSLMLRKRFHCHEYMDSWEESKEMSLPDRKKNYSNLTIEDVTDENYKHAKKSMERRPTKKFR